MCNKTRNNIIYITTKNVKNTCKRKWWHLSLLFRPSEKVGMSDQKYIYMIQGPYTHYMQQQT